MLNSEKQRWRQAHLDDAVNRAMTPDASADDTVDFHNEWLASAGVPQAALVVVALVDLQPHQNTATAIPPETLDPTNNAIPNADHILCMQTANMAHRNGRSEQLVVALHSIWMHQEFVREDAMAMGQHVALLVQAIEQRRVLEMPARVDGKMLGDPVLTLCHKASE